MVAFVCCHPWLFGVRTLVSWMGAFLIRPYNCCGACACAQSTVRIDGEVLLGRLCCGSTGMCATQQSIGEEL